ncbi:hypothetical protein CONPUDRAFT_156883 [Coniophora puteana RWD-64-598 SS2]|uniref:Uncharacterized protein n=1 Tax=Coniophora puteana (strain RWD-64-598) TaxID=741705 RepID=A0A5M3MF90_CONPW|nr:uncharacterized protein CONPUDRAFT_156883 [Coniophora puteana RWD-64-598 SS2]EIW77697.1 hypothetical protein CONPUDRAFT_156883 [Coniophora puteana RWD-64-598 SS2]
MAETRITRSRTAPVPPPPPPAPLKPPKKSKAVVQAEKAAREAADEQSINDVAVMELAAAKKQAAAKKPAPAPPPPVKLKARQKAQPDVDTATNATANSTSTVNTTANAADKRGKKSNTSASTVTKASAPSSKKTVSAPTSKAMGTVGAGIKKPPKSTEKNPQLAIESETKKREMRALTRKKIEVQRHQLAEHELNALTLHYRDLAIEYVTGSPNKFSLIRSWSANVPSDTNIPTPSPPVSTTGSKALNAARRKPAPLQKTKPTVADDEDDGGPGGLQEDDIEDIEKERAALALEDTPHLVAPAAILSVPYTQASADTREPAASSKLKRKRSGSFIDEDEDEDENENENENENESEGEGEGEGDPDAEGEDQDQEHDDNEPVEHAATPAMEQDHVLEDIGVEAPDDVRALEVIKVAEDEPTTEEDDDIEIINTTDDQGEQDVHMASPGDADAAINIEDNNAEVIHVPTPARLGTSETTTKAVVQALKTTAKVSRPVPRPTKKIKVEPSVLNVTVIDDDARSASIKSRATSASGRKVWKNGDLPPGALVNRLWGDKFIPTIIWYLGLGPEAWSFNENHLDAIANVWRAVYKQELPADEYTVSGAVFNLTKKKVTEWRGGFGATAVAALINVFAKHQLTAAEDQVEYVKELLREQNFLSEYIDEEGVGQGFLKGSYFHLIVSHHHFSTGGRVHVPEYADHEKVKPHYIPFAALLLAAAACERALKLARDGRLGDIAAYLKRVPSLDEDSLANANKTTKVIRAVKRSNKPSKKDDKGKVKAKKDAAGDAPEEPEEDPDFDQVDAFSRDSCEKSTYNFSYRIGRCPETRQAEAFAMAARYSTVQRKGVEIEDEEQTAPAYEIELDERAFGPSDGVPSASISPSAASLATSSASPSAPSIQCRSSLLMLSSCFHRLFLL